MTAHRKDPFRKVTEALLMDDHLGRWWMLTLECGHDEVRRVTYPKRAGLPWGGYRPKPVRNVEERAPAPCRVRCEQCGVVISDLQSAAE
jgi:hypothetical protein